MKRYFKKTWPCYPILFLLFFVAPPLLLRIPNLAYIEFLPYLTLASMLVIGFYCAQHGGNGWYDLLPVVAVYLLQCLMILIRALVQVLQRGSFGGDVPFYVVLLVFAIPVIPQLLTIAIVKPISQWFRSRHSAS